MLRAYFVNEYDEPEGLAVIAETAKEAKQIAYSTGNFSCEWIYLRVKWMRERNIDGLKKGIVNDSMEGVRRGIFAYVENHPCDRCGHIGNLEGYKGKALCSRCYEEAV